MTKNIQSYKEFLEAKIVVAGTYGSEIDKSKISPIALPHQKDIIHWAISGGRRAIFASFGLGKTLMQLEIARLIIEITEKPFLICMPLGVVGEFRDDNDLLNTGLQIKYITETDSFDSSELAIYVTNYERVRKGDINPHCFGGVSFDEASILRNLKTETTNYVLKHFSKINYRFVATATPTPNDFIEILNYADYLGVIDRGHALTRFFQRDSTKAGHLTLYENKKEEFVKRGVEEMKKGKVCVFLIPVSTSTKLFHEWIKPYATEIEFVKGRIKFGKRDKNGNFFLLLNDKGKTQSGTKDSMVVVFDGRS